MQRPTLVALLILSFSLSAAADESAFRLRVGLTAPEGSSAYWKEKAELYQGSADDLEDITYGLDWNNSLGRGLGILLSGSLFEGQAEQDLLQGSGSSGSLETRLRLTSVDALLTFMGVESWRIRPWIGVGARIVRWRLKEEGLHPDGDGDFVAGSFSEEDLTFGLVAAAGVDFWIRSNWGLSIDYRQSWVEDEASGHLDGRGDIDLSVNEVAFGFVWTF